MLVVGKVVIGILMEIHQVATQNLESILNSPSSGCKSKPPLQLVNAMLNDDLD